MRFLPCVLAGSLLGALYVFPMEAALAAREGLAAWAFSIVPSLGPAMALCLFLSTHLPGKRALQVLGAFLCGSPGGARLMQENAYGPGGALHDAALTGVISPLFFLSTLAGWLENGKAALLLYFCHGAGAVITSLCIKRPEILPGKNLPLSLPQCAEKAVFSLLQVGYYVMLGTVAARMLSCALPGLPPKATAFVQCLMEVCGGARQLLSHSPSLPLISFVTSFGGLSILMQNFSLWKEKGVSAPSLLGVRLMHGAISFLLCFFLQNLPFFG